MTEREVIQSKYGTVISKIELGTVIYKYMKQHGGNGQKSEEIINKIANSKKIIIEFDEENNEIKFNIK